MVLNISKDVDELSQKVANWMAELITETLRRQDRFLLVLSGGNTPKKLNLLLAKDTAREKIDWSKVHIFWGDERFVPFDDARNNAKMAFDTLLDHVPVPPSQIHIMRTDIDPEDSATQYERILKDYFPDLVHSFDLVLLGLGDNMHTLSLFPGEAVIQEKDHWVRSVFVKEVDMERITLTAPIVNLASHIAFLVSGQDKAIAVSHVIQDSYEPERYPAQIINPVAGEVYWFLDQQSASMLSKR